MPKPTSSRAVLLWLALLGGVVGCDGSSTTSPLGQTSTGGSGQAAGDAGHATSGPAGQGGAGSAGAPAAGGAAGSLAAGHAGTGSTKDGKLDCCEPSVQGCLDPDLTYDLISALTYDCFLNPWTLDCIDRALSRGLLGCPVCTQESDCQDPARPHCSWQGVCVACVVGTHCDDPGLPFCNQPLGECAQCASNADCPAEQPRCRQGSCVAPCTSDAECFARNPATPQCASGECDECSSDTHCLDPVRPVCDHQRCEPGCQGDADCPGAHCDAATHRCVSCGAGLPCEAPLVCVGGSCAQCANDVDCMSAFAPHCDTVVGHACRECTTDAHCSDPARPVCSGNTCQECAHDSDCLDPARPRCEGNTCVLPCQSQADCAGPAVCLPEGVCGECNSDAVCTDPARPLCAYLKGESLCAECRFDDADCHDPARPLCREDGLCVGCKGLEDCADDQGCRDGACVPGCRQDADCLDPALPLCATDRGLCVAPCQSNDDCPGQGDSSPRRDCDLSTGRCERCTSDAPCGSQRCSPTTHTCVACLTSDDCHDPVRPVCKGGSCGCSGDASCKLPSKDHCGVQGECAECRLNAHCDDPARPHCDGQHCVE